MTYNPNNDAGIASILNWHELTDIDKSAMGLALSGRFFANITTTSEEIIKANYVKHVYTDTGVSYNCYAPVGTPITEEKWRVEKVLDNGSRYFPEDTGSAFAKFATNLATVSGYAYLI